MADDFTPAKRGDLILIEVAHSVTYAPGSGKGTERWTTYHLAMVTSVTREGVMKAAERPAVAPHPLRFGEATRSWVVPADKVGGDGWAFLTRLGQTVDFDSIDQARDTIRMEASRLPA